MKYVLYGLILLFVNLNATAGSSQSTAGVRFDFYKREQVDSLGVKSQRTFSNPVAQVQYLKKLNNDESLIFGEFITSPDLNIKSQIGRFYLSENLGGGFKIIVGKQFMPLASMESSQPLIDHFLVSSFLKEIPKVSLPGISFVFNPFGNEIFIQAIKAPAINNASGNIYSALFSKDFIPGLFQLKLSYHHEATDRGHNENKYQLLGMRGKLKNVVAEFDWSKKISEAGDLQENPADLITISQVLNLNYLYNNELIGAKFIWDEINNTHQSNNQFSYQLTAKHRLKSAPETYYQMTFNANKVHFYGISPSNFDEKKLILSAGFEISL